MRMIFGAMAVAIAVSCANIFAAVAAPVGASAIADVLKASVIIQEVACPSIKSRICARRNVTGTCVSRADELSG